MKHVLDCLITVTTIQAIRVENERHLEHLIVGIVPEREYPSVVMPMIDSR